MGIWWWSRVDLKSLKLLSDSMDFGLQQQQWKVSNDSDRDRALPELEEAIKSKLKPFTAVVAEKCGFDG